MNTYKVKILNIKRVRDISYFLLLEKPKKFEFIPGQFITITATINNENVTRAYSIASLPTEDFLMLYIKRVKGGRMSNYLYNLSQQDSLEIKGPFGSLTFQHIGTNFKHLIFLVAGSGIAPVRPLVWWYRKHTNISLTVVHQERYKDLLVFETFFKEYQVEYIPILSREKVPGIRFGHFQDYLTDIVKQDAKYFVVGAPGFVNAAVSRLGKENTLIEKWQQ